MIAGCRFVYVVDPAPSSTGEPVSWNPMACTVSPESPLTLKRAHAIFRHYLILLGEIEKHRFQFLSIFRIKDLNIAEDLDEYEFL